MAKPLKDRQAELMARTLAAQKLAIEALNLIGQIADRVGLEIDFDQIAQAELNHHEEGAPLTPASEVERRAGEITVNVYRHLAAERRDRDRSVN